MNKTDDCSGVIEKTDFSVTELQDEYYNCTFIGCNFSNQTINNPYFEKCVFKQCNFTLAKFTGNLKDVRFIDCKTTGADFSGISKFSGIFHFEKSALNYVNFYGIKIRNCSFICCNLYEACFDEADLTSSVFDRCDLSRTSFFKTNLEKVDFSSAFNFSIDPSTNRLKKTVFSEQNLRGLVTHLDIVIKEDENGPDFVQAL
ncbi:MAG TPA: pentapeptide repeat-containing protein [Candidatus Avirikenella pullistercoris]|nr:pentapeptide repeat-containing protein [Candidatus Avirikenella pullistercoris]